MKNNYEVKLQRDIIRKRILESNYPSGMGYPESITEYNTLCWILEEEPEDLNKIKNDYLLRTL